MQYGSLIRAERRRGADVWAPASCARIRNIMSILFNYAIRHYLFDRSPIRSVQQSAKRIQTPAVLSVSEIKSLLPALGLRERTLVLLDACTGFGVPDGI
jgi:integrase